MKRYRDEDFWFEIVTDTAPDGQRGARYYQVHCRRCSNKQRYHASGASNEALRKIFQRAGWTINAHNRFKHYCPDCSRRHQAQAAATTNIIPTAPAAARPNPIQRLWLSISDDERVEFWHWLHDTYACWLDNSGHISLIARAPAPPAPEPEPEPLGAMSEVTHAEPPPDPPPPPPVEDGPAQPRQVQDQPPLTMGSDGQPAPEPTEDDDDDDVADWWKEIEAKRKIEK